MGCCASSPPFALPWHHPPAPGDIDSQLSFEYKVCYRVVPGLTFDVCQSGKLTDEVAAHLDPVRRAALFDRLRAGRAQVWMTGTEIAPFCDIQAEAAVWQVRGGV